MGKQNEFKRDLIKLLGELQSERPGPNTVSDEVMALFDKHKIDKRYFDSIIDCFNEEKFTNLYQLEQNLAKWGLGR